MDFAEIAKLLSLLRSLPPGAVEDALKLVQEGTQFAADVKAFLDKYPQVVEAIKQLQGGK